MTRNLLPIFLILCLGWTAATWADQPMPGASSAPGNAYVATVPVTGTSDAQRDTAISAALAVVLRRVAPNVIATPDVLSQAIGLARSFDYQRAASGNGLELRVQFDPGSVNRLIQQTRGESAGIAVTGGPVSSSSAAFAAEAGSGRLWVDGIDNAHTFTTLLALLRGAPQLQDVIPVAAHGDGVLLRVDFNASLPAIVTALTGPGGHLAPEQPAHPGADASLRWVP